MRSDLRRKGFCVSFTKPGKDIKSDANGSNNLLASQVMKYKGVFFATCGCSASF